MNKAMKALLAGVLCVGTAGGAWAQERVDAETYQRAAKFEFGQSRRDLAAIEADIRKASREEYPAIEGRLIEMLKSPEATVDAKRFACRYLGIVGTGKAVGELSPLLSDERLSHPARMALEVIADPAAGKALVAALDKTQGKMLAGVIGSLGVRRDVAATGALVKFTNDSEETVAAAAIAALGQIGTVDAAKALDDAAGKAPEALKRDVMRARITCANHLAAGGKAKEAAAMFAKLTGADVPLAERAAASQGLIEVSDRERALARMTELLGSEERALRAAALAAFRADRGGLRSGMTEKLPTLKPVAQLALIGFLNDFPNVPARNPLLAIVQSGKDERVRLAAIEALAVHGEAADVPMLVKLAAAGGGDAEKKAAKSALANLGKPGTDETLINLIDSVEPPSRAVVIDALSARHAKEALPVLVRLTRGSDRRAAEEAIGAIGAIGGTEELKTLVGIIMAGGSDELRNAAERAAGNLCARVGDPQATSRVLVPAYEEAEATPAKVALLKLMPRARGEEALGAVRKATTAQDEKVSEAAVRVLAGWPEASAIPALFELAEKSDANQTRAILAMQGVVRLAGQRELGDDKRIDALEQVLEKAQRVEEKKAALAALGNVRSVKAVELLGQYADDEALVSDAAQAAVRATRELRGENREKAEEVLEKFEGKAVGEDVKKRIEEVRKEEGGRRRRR